MDLQHVSKKSIKLSLCHSVLIFKDNSQVSFFCLSSPPPLHYQPPTPLCYQQLTRFSTPTVCQTRQMPPPASLIVIIDNNFCYFLCQPSSVCGASQVLAACAVVSLKIEKCFQLLLRCLLNHSKRGKLPFYLLLAAAQQQL